MRTAIYRYKFGAAQRGLTWALTEAECKALFLAECHYCGAEPANQMAPSSGSKHGGFTYNGIDRIRNDEGYTLHNVVPCCFICNRAKNTLNYDEFITWLAAASSKALREATARALLCA